MEIRKQKIVTVPPDIRKRLLAWLQPILIVLAGSALVLVLAVTPQDGLHRSVYPPLIVVILILLSAAVILNRIGYTTPSAACTVAAAIIGPWGSLVLDPGVFLGDFFPLIYVSVSVLLSSMLFPLLFTGILASVQFAALILVVAYSPASLLVNWPSFLAFICIISLLSIAANYMVARHLKLIASQHEELQELTIRDHLTGLFNRRYFEATLEYEIQRAAQKELPIGLILMDIDFFKQFNDRLGHAAGDDLLRRIGSLLCQKTDIADIVCRLGGDEFAVVIPHADQAAVEQTAELLRTELKQLELSYRSEELTAVSVSQGIALFPDHGTTREELILSADAALYRAKDQGRDRVVSASV